jgi:hypothetical protein
MQRLGRNMIDPLFQQLSSIEAYQREGRVRRCRSTLWPAAV